MNYTTSQVAKELGISKSTLLNWLRAGKIPEPRRTELGGVEYRTWTKADVDKARKFHAAHFWNKGSKRS